MNEDTTATIHAGILETAKDDIQSQINRLRLIQEREDTSEEMSNRIDKEIDALLCEKDNLPDTLFAEIAEGTQPSPIISGGDVLSRENFSGSEEIPF